jgi:hypothetical protein
VSQENTVAEALAKGAHDTDSRAGLRLQFRLRSKGGGRTRVHLWISSKEFGALATKMMRADSGVAQRIFLEAVLSGIKKAARIKPKKTV